jgi:heavy metal translocating P-type ATPase
MDHDHPTSHAAGSHAGPEGAPSDGAPLIDLSFPVQGMTCASCVGRVERVLSRVPGVQEVRVNLATERADLKADASVTHEALSLAVEKAGYKLGEERRQSARSHADHSHEHEHVHEADSVELRRKVFLAVLLSLPVFVLEMGGHAIPGFHAWLQGHLAHALVWKIELVLTLAVLLGPGREIVTHGFRTLFSGAPEMNSLVAVGTTAAFAYSITATFFPHVFSGETHNVYYEAASVVLTLVLVGRWLEARAKGRASEAISRLVKLTPQLATVRRGEQWVEVPSAEVREGDQVLMKPGLRFAVDGTVIEGESHVDESMLTGEPLPVLKSLTSKVSAGTVNQSGTLVFRATEVGEKTLLAQIVRLVEDAQATKLPIQALVDRVTFVFVPIVLGLSVVTFAAWMVLRPELGFSFALVNAVGVLIIACPCAMGLATPTSILVATGRGAELGLLFRQGAALERLEHVRVVAFDKTGTLTLGRPELSDFHATGGFTRELLLPWLAALETRSEHPIARAVVRAAEQGGISPPEVSDFAAEVGLGVTGTVEGRRIRVGAPRYLEQQGLDLKPFVEVLRGLQSEGKTAMGIAVDDQLAAVFAVSDPIRTEAVAGLRELKSTGVLSVMISGDQRITAEAVAKRLGIEEVVAEVLPAGKVRAVQELKKKYGALAFVGDGINDAPVLAAADVGLAMGAGTDIAIEAAQVVLVRDDIRSVPIAVRLSRSTLRNIRQNLFWAFGYNVVLIPVAAGALYPNFGILLSPVLAALAMALSSVFVVTNSLRLRRFGRATQAAATPQKGALA